MPVHCTVRMAMTPWQAPAHVQSCDRPWPLVNCRIVGTAMCCRTCPALKPASPHTGSYRCIGILGLLSSPRTAAAVACAKGCPNQRRADIQASPSTVLGVSVDVAHWQRSLPRQQFMTLIVTFLTYTFFGSRPSPPPDPPLGFATNPMQICAQTSLLLAASVPARHRPPVCARHVSPTPPLAHAGANLVEGCASSAHLGASPSWLSARWQPLVVALRHRKTAVTRPQARSPVPGAFDSFARPCAWVALVVLRVRAENRTSLP